MTIGAYSDPAFALEWSYGLTESCDDFVIDQGPCGSFNADLTGNDGSTPQSWAERYAIFETTEVTVMKGKLSLVDGNADGVWVITELIVNAN